MKLLTFQAPNAMRVHSFLIEKGLELPCECVDLMSGAGRAPDFLAKNSLGEVPVLELDDGMHLTESVAICRYLETRHPSPPLFGTDPQEQARIEMWIRRMELRVFAPTSEVARHELAFFRASVEQIPAYAETQRRLQIKRWEWLDGELSDGRTYLAADRFSMADIVGMTVLLVADLAQTPIPAHLHHAQRWEAAVRGRESWLEFGDPRLPQTPEKAA